MGYRVLAGVLFLGILWAGVVVAQRLADLPRHRADIAHQLGKLRQLAPGVAWQDDSESVHRGLLEMGGLGADPEIRSWAETVQTEMRYRDRSRWTAGIAGLVGLCCAAGVAFAWRRSRAASQLRPQVG